MVKKNKGDLEFGIGSGNGKWEWQREKGYLVKAGKMEGKWFML